MNKRQTIITSISVIFAVGVIIFLIVGSGSTRGINVGDKAADFTLKDVYGTEYTLSETLEEKPVVLVFGSFT